MLPFFALVFVVLFKFCFIMADTRQWNESGTLLVSGSDDTHIILWDFHQGADPKMRARFRTGHYLNIFHAK